MTIGLNPNAYLLKKGKIERNCKKTFNVKAMDIIIHRYFVVDARLIFFIIENTGTK